MAADPKFSTGCELALHFPPDDSNEQQDKKKTFFLGLPYISLQIFFYCFPPHLPSAGRNEVRLSLPTSALNVLQKSGVEVAEGALSCSVLPVPLQHRAVTASTIYLLVPVAKNPPYTSFFCPERTPLEHQPFPDTRNKAAGFFFFSFFNPPSLPLLCK